MRQALDGSSNEAGFELACQLIEQIRWLDEQRALTEAVPLVADELERWPDEARILPPAWAMRGLRGDLPEAMARLGRALVFDERVCLRDEDVDALVDMTRLVSPVRLDLHV